MITTVLKKIWNKIDQAFTFEELEYETVYVQVPVTEEQNASRHTMSRAEYDRQIDEAIALAKQPNKVKHKRVLP